MTVTIMKDTEEALTYYESIKDYNRITILKEGIIYYIKHLNK